MLDTSNPQSLSVTGLLSATDLANSLPRAENGWDGSRLHQIWVQYGYNTDGGGYWDAPVGDGDRTAMACYGRTACQEAAKVWANTHNLAAAKQVAATYCQYHAKRCTIDEGANNSMKDAAETVPILVAGEPGAAGRAGGCLQSFVGGTEAQLADGSTKPIEDVLRISALGPLDGGGRGGLRTLGFWRRPSEPCGGFRSVRRWGLGCGSRRTATTASHRTALTSILHDGPPTESVDRFAFGG
ncbi:hypothetical protein [Streptomyces mirabilis]|uniref:hypothetical protein n=1 Tax=Streptomyces mirabilis TaxID=68239 RepID=UPI0036AC96C5